MAKITYPESFFARPTLDVAKELLGSRLHRRLPDGIVLQAEITEVEAYTADDPACHAFKGRTARCQVLFGPPGRAYVYFIYGMYHCLNVVTELEGIAGAVLIRGLASASQSPPLNGPGKICRAWQIDRSHNGIMLTDTASEMWISPGRALKFSEIRVSPRIGISQAKDRPWRFFLD